MDSITRRDVESRFRLLTERHGEMPANQCLSFLRSVYRRPCVDHEVRTTRNADRPAVYVGLPSQDLSLVKEALDRIAEDARRHEGTSEVLLLGRYRHLRPRNLHALPKQCPGLRFTWMTVHRSKGLEADYVVVLGLCSGKYGFPAEIADDPLLDLVLSTPEAHPNAEERRLLYVAVTRARRQVLLLADGGPPSEFVTELIDGGYEVEVFGRPPEADVAWLRQHLHVDRFNLVRQRPDAGKAHRELPVVGVGETNADRLDKESQAVRVRGLKCRLLSHRLHTEKRSGFVGGDDCLLKHAVGQADAALVSGGPVCAQRPHVLQDDWHVEVPGQGHPAPDPRRKRILNHCPGRSVLWGPPYSTYGL